MNEVLSEPGASPDRPAKSGVTPGRAVTLSDYLPTLNAAAFSDITIVRDPGGAAYFRFGDETTVCEIDSPQSQTRLQQRAYHAGGLIRPHELRELLDVAKTIARVAAPVRKVAHRVAEIERGAVIDLGTDDHSRVVVAQGQVEIVRNASSTLFHRPDSMRAMFVPADDGDAGLLDPFLNLPDSGRRLLRGCISYVLTHGKTPRSAFPIMVLGGGEGVGKSTLSRRIKRVVDPSSIDIQTLPRTERDLAIAIQPAHLTVFDNVRAIKPHMADALCIASTGGVVTTRQLYTDAGLVTLNLHGAVILNGVHALVDQPDLASRVLPLTLLPLDEKHRRSEGELDAEFEKCGPRILRGLFDLAARIFQEIPSVKPTHPERMLDFVVWLGGMERVDGVPEGTYQSMYSKAIQRGMLETLEENPLAVAVMELVDGDRRDWWTGTPAELLKALSSAVDRRTTFSREWPVNAIALSRRLRALVPALRRQRIDVQFPRGHERQISINILGGADNE